ncbi:unnamed protein product [marine sediment metagenome]|uniref:Transcription elongation factor GreA n=1 Tax=marine sediment metagenome TaxID=412755 RepID=X0Y745_9ZZZZ
MKTDKDIYLTKEGLANLKKELVQLEKQKRPKLVKRLAKARNMGDLSENSEYTSAREELGMMDGRIAELKVILTRVKTIRKTTGGTKKVCLGCKVTVKVNGETHVYDLVGEWEADPMNKRISHSSPLGKALLGKKRGEKVEVKAPAGKITYEIKKID